MKTKFITLVTALTLTTFASIQPAKAFDVIGPGNLYVKVTRNQNQVKFEECVKGSNPECLRTLGPK